ncbi:MAG: AraC family transcriptional regulator [Bacteroidetes bacterium]|nr:AraC family transcriptional regulator [Bacteroidota bacterium]
MNTININALLVILIFGSLILLAFLNVTNPLKVNKKANFWFGIFLFLWATFWLEEITLLIWKENLNGYLALFFHYIQFFTPIVYFISVVFFTNPNYRFHKTYQKYLILPIIFLILLLLQKLYDLENSNIFQLLIIGIILIQVLFYSIKSYLLIRKHQKKILVLFSNTSEINLNWLEYIILSILSISIIISVYNLFFNPLTLNVYMNVTFLILIYVIAYNSLKQKDIFPFDELKRNQIISINEEEQFTEQKKKIVSDDELLILKSKLEDLMIKQEPYLDSELNLIKLSELLNITSHQLSYVINSGFNENFFQFINKYRVEKAKKLLVNEDLNSLSILGIAFESGFNSKTSFNTIFKKITNNTPSDFKKMSSKL